VEAPTEQRFPYFALAFADENSLYCSAEAVALLKTLWSRLISTSLYILLYSIKFAQADATKEGLLDGAGNQLQCRKFDQGYQEEQQQNGAARWLYLCNLRCCGAAAAALLVFI
jgi:hypothetical protein